MVQTVCVRATSVDLPCIPCIVFLVFHLVQEVYSGPPESKIYVPPQIS